MVSTTVTILPHLLLYRQRNTFQLYVDCYNLSPKTYINLYFCMRYIIMPKLSLFLRCLRLEMNNL